MHSHIHRIDFTYYCVFENLIKLNVQRELESARKRYQVTETRKKRETNTI